MILRAAAHHNLQVLCISPYGLDPPFNHETRNIVTSWKNAFDGTDFKDRFEKVIFGFASNETAHPVSVVGALEVFRDMFGVKRDKQESPSTQTVDEEGLLDKISHLSVT
jgi:hypothetical protein